MIKMCRLPNHSRGPRVTNEKRCPLCKPTEETTYRDWLPALQAKEHTACWQSQHGSILSNKAAAAIYFYELKTGGMPSLRRAQENLLLNFQVLLLQRCRQKMPKPLDAHLELLLQF